MLARPTLWFSSIHGYLRSQQMLRHRGTILTFWAMVEGSIDQANHAAWEVSGRSISNVVPQSLRWKIKLFETLHTKVAAFHDLKPLSESILASLEKQKSLRHLMAHGIYDIKGRPGWHFTMTTFEKDGSLGSYRIMITSKEFKLAENDLLNLCNQIVSYLSAFQRKLNENIK